MKKIVLTEIQAKKLMSKVIKEQEDYTLGDGRFHIMADCDFNDYHTTYKGGEISDIARVKFDISYLIDISHEKHGISDIRIYDIKGPSTVKTIIEYYPLTNEPDNDNLVKESIVIPLDWKKLDIDKDYEMEYFGVDKDVTVYVIDDRQGGLKTRQIDITLKQF
jgi:hypothetical protein